MFARVNFSSCTASGGEEVDICVWELYQNASFLSSGIGVSIIIMDPAKLALSAGIAMFVSYKRLRNPFVEWEPLGKPPYAAAKPGDEVHGYVVNNWILYMLVWLFVDALIITGWVYHVLTTPTFDAWFLGIFCVIAFNVTMRDIWICLNWKWDFGGNHRRRAIWALLVAIFLLMSGLVIPILYGIEENWISMSMFAAYWIWLVFGPLVVSAMQIRKTAHTEETNV